MENYFMTILVHADLTEDDFDRFFSCLGMQVFDHIAYAVNPVGVLLSSECRITGCFGCTCFESKDKNSEVSSEEQEYWKTIHKKYL